MRVHFIAIGGAAMHNLALALYKKGYYVTGSDDEIFEPSRTRLNDAGILPENMGWDAEKIATDIDAVILGMHAHGDNPELKKAKELGLKIFSYPEFLYEQTKDKKRVVIAGSHGKTTITSMIMHVLRYCGKKFDYMVGAQIDGFDTMVSLSSDAEVAVFEGDEYLASALDMRPKFHLYKPHIALISGIEWDHINVFKTFEVYLEQFEIFINKIEDGGSLYYYGGDKHLKKLMQAAPKKELHADSYKEHPAVIKDNVSYLKTDEGEKKLQVFGTHNLQNISGAMNVCIDLGITMAEFYEAIKEFGGSAKRMQKIYESDTTIAFLDFAHAPSKVRATQKAVREQYPNRRVIAILELHTYSSLNKAFLPHYEGVLDGADEALVYFSPDVVKHKRLPEITTGNVKNAFGCEKLKVFTKTEELTLALRSLCSEQKSVYLYMSSGNFGGLSKEELAEMAK